MKAIRVAFLAFGVACAITGLYLTGLIFAIGSILLYPWDHDDE